jgi:hypothetical protein
VQGGAIGARTLTLRNMSDQIERVGNLWADMRTRKRSWRRPIEKLRSMMKTNAQRERTSQNAKTPPTRIIPVMMRTAIEAICWNMGRTVRSDDV